MLGELFTDTDRPTHSLSEAWTDDCVRHQPGPRRLHYVGPHLDGEHEEQQRQGKSAQVYTLSLIMARNDVLINPFMCDS